MHRSPPSSKVSDYFCFNRTFYTPHRSGIRGRRGLWTTMTRMLCALQIFGRYQRDAYSHLHCAAPSCARGASSFFFQIKQDDDRIAAINTFSNFVGIERNLDCVMASGNTKGVVLAVIETPGSRVLQAPVRKHLVAEGVSWGPRGLGPTRPRGVAPGELEAPTAPP